MRRKSLTDSIIDFFMSFPWWTHFTLALIILISPLAIDAYLIQYPSDHLSYLNRSWNFVARTISSGLLITTAILIFLQLKRKILFYKQDSIEDLYNLNWREFETLVHETFKKLGYDVRQKGGARADGGIDLEMFGKGKKVIVQCKHWKKTQVGVAVIREMYGVMIHEQAQEVYVVTCGYFTKDAKQFAQNKPVFLIDGRKLVNWINNIKGN